MKDCLFCRMANGTIPVQKVYENSDVFCIRDIEPHAKYHFLVIPKKHFSSLTSVFPSGQSSEASSKTISSLFEAATHIAYQEGLMPDGFRCVINTEKNAGQTVFHLHLHVLGGEPLKGGFGA